MRSVFLLIIDFDYFELKEKEGDINFKNLL